MTKLLLGFALLFSVNAVAQSGDGPFGYDIGQGVDNYPDCKPADTLGMYVCSAPGKPHPEMEAYYVQAFPHTGVCFIKGVGKDISDIGMGTRTKKSIDDIAEQLASVYGTDYEKMDILLPSSIWDDYDDWMMGVLRGDRVYMYNWTSGSGYVPKKKIANIYMSASATSSTTGYVSIEFYGENEPLCAEAENDVGASAF